MTARQKEFSSLKRVCEQWLRRLGCTDNPYRLERYMSAKLTDQQRRCAEMRLAGLQQWEIAQRMGISQQMVSRHLRGAKSKLLGINERTHHGVPQEVPMDPADMDRLQREELLGVL
ncbi:hypothetical protein LCGC14_1996090 [marine sediment metagenome]|uniref:HTH luxR-type domain-containing protein n=1 Tax=marine sediment metagenome TaxID=412755 RepID=A0A0F9FSN5_9ZZZZ